MEIENLTAVAVVWLVAMGIMFMPEIIGMAGWDLTTKIIGGIVLIPIAYFIVQWQANK